MFGTSSIMRDLFGGGKYIPTHVDLENKEIYCDQGGPMLWKISGAKEASLMAHFKRKGTGITFFSPKVELTHLESLGLSKEDTQKLREIYNENEDLFWTMLNQMLGNV